VIPAHSRISWGHYAADIRSKKALYFQAHNFAAKFLIAEAPASGQAPQEVEPHGKAAAELEALFAFVDKTATAKARPEAVPILQEARR
jgi:hypothetical protein